MFGNEQLSLLLSRVVTIIIHLLSSIASGPFRGIIDSVLDSGAGAADLERAQSTRLGSQVMSGFTDLMLGFAILLCALVVVVVGVLWLELLNLLDSADRSLVRWIQGV